MTLFRFILFLFFFVSLQVHTIQQTRNLLFLLLLFLVVKEKASILFLFLFQLAPCQLFIWNFHSCNLVDNCILFVYLFFYSFVYILDCEDFKCCKSGVQFTVRKRTYNSTMYLEGETSFSSHFVWYFLYRKSRYRFLLIDILYLMKVAFYFILFYLW